MNLISYREESLLISLRFLGIIFNFETFIIVNFIIK